MIIPCDTNNEKKKNKQFQSHGYECSITAIYRTTKFLGEFYKICKSHLICGKNVIITVASKKKSQNERFKS